MYWPGGQGGGQPAGARPPNQIYKREVPGFLNKIIRVNDVTVVSMKIVSFFREVGLFGKPESLLGLTTLGVAPHNARKLTREQTRPVINIMCLKL